jgi:hypothetical protein
MAGVKSRVQRLEQERHRLCCEDAIRQFEGRSEEELEFFSHHGHFARLSDNNRRVKPQEFRTFQQELKDCSAGEQMRTSRILQCMAAGLSDGTVAPVLSVVVKSLARYEANGMVQGHILACDLAIMLNENEVRAYEGASAIVKTQSRYRLRS